MCKKELIETIKARSSLVMIQNYVEEIVKEKYHTNLLNEEIFSLFEKVVELAKDLYEEDKNSQEFDITSIFSILLSLCKKLEINILQIEKEKQKIYI